MAVWTVGKLKKDTRIIDGVPGQAAGVLGLRGESVRLKVEYANEWLDMGEPVVEAVEEPVVKTPKTVNRRLKKVNNNE